uniref:Uncharacterized protein n=1 Tax=Nonomuraea gerenzanensis TaxID=93944 RepID=A0A1M4EH29_9ACTN|nr:hypothetical protein BN4615_P7715 [Nonomuraea gerenzanensis]
MTRARLLHCVHRQGSNDIDRLLVQVGPFKGWHEFGAQVLDLRNLVVIGRTGRLSRLRRLAAGCAARAYTEP